jgi:hypothetical protein
VLVAAVLLFVGVKGITVKGLGFKLREKE